MPPEHRRALLHEGRYRLREITGAAKFTLERGFQRQLRGEIIAGRGRKGLFDDAVSHGGACCELADKAGWLVRELATIGDAAGVRRLHAWLATQPRAATTMSQASARFAAAPTAMPFSAATVILG